MYTNNNDPLAAYERAHRQSGFLHSFKRTCTFVISYLLLSGAIFTVLLVGLNYTAYSSRIINWVNPDSLMQARDEVNHILASATSVSVYASDEATMTEAREDLSTLTEKVLTSDPQVIYSRSYTPQ